MRRSRRWQTSTISSRQLWCVAHPRMHCCTVRTCHHSQTSKKTGVVRELAPTPDFVVRTRSPYWCDECERGFGNPGAFMQHNMAFHPLAGEAQRAIDAIPILPFLTAERMRFNDETQVHAQPVIRPCSHATRAQQWELVDIEDPQSIESASSIASADKRKSNHLGGALHRKSYSAKTKLAMLDALANYEAALIERGKPTMGALESMAKTAGIDQSMITRWRQNRYDAGADALYRSVRHSASAVCRVPIVAQVGKNTRDRLMTIRRRGRAWFPDEEGVVFERFSDRRKKGRRCVRARVCVCAYVYACGVLPCERRVSGKFLQRSMLLLVKERHPNATGFRASRTWLRRFNRRFKISW